MASWLALLLVGTYELSNDILMMIMIIIMTIIFIVSIYHTSE